jgi:hypothetical protein
VNGTLFAGPQQEPFVCENAYHGLAPAVDASCAAPTVVTYFYRDKGGEWKPFDPKSARPADIGTTRTTKGKVVPLIVRQEKGVINRSAYVINILHDPAAGPLPSAFASSPASGWNGKLVYSFGGGVQANYHMGRGLGGMAGTDKKFYMEDVGAGFRDYFVARGYAVAAGSLNVMGTNNDDVKSAETVAKVKEHFIEEFGPPLFTIGHGASGGSMQQHLIGNNYPGLLDGIMPARSYPDAMSFLQPLYDCELLEHVFDTTSSKWTTEQKGAVAGKYWGYCVTNGTRYPNARPEFCDAAVKEAVANDPKLKAKGVRCTYQDNLANIFGIDPKTGLAQQSLRQCRRTVRPAGAQRRQDQLRPVRRGERTGGRPRCQRQGGAAAHGRRPRRLAPGLCERTRQRGRRRARVDPDRRYPLLCRWRAATALRCPQGCRHA